MWKAVAIRKMSAKCLETDDKTGKVVAAKSELIPLVIAKVGEDKDVKEFLEANIREPNVDSPIGTSAEKISKKPVAADRLDAPIDDWIADLIKAYAGTEIALTNNGGTRKSLPKGVITRRDLMEIHPFDNKISVVKVNGKFLKKFIKTGLSPRNLFSYSGLQITYKLNRKGEPKSIKIFFNGKPLENKKVYEVATNAYIAGGGSEGFLFKKIPDTDKKQIGTTTMRDLMENALKKGSTKAPETGRIKQRA